MGQIVAKNAKAKRCNIQAIQEGGSLVNVILKNGECMLVSSDNSIDTNGNGLFDCYVIGDGITACGQLSVIKIDEISEGELFGEGDSPASFNSYTDTVWNKEQNLSTLQKQRIQANIGIHDNYYTKTDIESIVPNPDEEDLTKQTINNSAILRFKDKEYSPTAYSGLGRKYLRKNITNSVNILTQSMIANANTIYYIQYDYDLNGATITIPNNCVLEFDGGSISNGVLGLNNAFLKGEPKILCNITGTISNPTNNVTYFGIDNSGQTDCSSRLQYLLTSLESVHFPQGEYLISNQVTMPKIARISGEGQDSILNITYNGYAFVYPYNSSISNNWFRYSFKNISINGDYPDIDDTTSELTNTSFLLTEVGTYPYAMEVVNCHF